MLATATFFGCPGDMDSDTLLNGVDPCPVYFNPLPINDPDTNGLPTERPVRGLQSGWRLLAY